MPDIINPFKDFVATISPIEFEKYCMKILQAYAEKENLKGFSIIHNKNIPSNDGNYQIDIYAEFIAMGVKFKVLVECKRYTHSIEREKVAILANKLQSIGAQKGILISTSGFQSGAAQYAKVHGIALIQIFDNCVRHIQNSVQSKDTMLNKLIKEYHDCMPNYYAKEYDEFDFPQRDIYPSNNEMEEIKKHFVATHSNEILQLKGLNK